MSGIETAVGEVGQTRRFPDIAALTRRVMEAITRRNSAISPSVQVQESGTSDVVGRAAAVPDSLPVVDVAKEPEAVVADGSLEISLRVAEILGVRSPYQIDVSKIPEIPDPSQCDTDSEAYADLLGVIRNNDNFIKCMEGASELEVSQMLEGMIEACEKLKAAGISVSIFGIFLICAGMSINPAQVIINLGKNANDYQERGVRFLDVSNKEQGETEHVGTRKGQWLIYKTLHLNRHDIEQLSKKPSDMLHLDGGIPVGALVRQAAPFIFTDQ